MKKAAIIAVTVATLGAVATTLPAEARDGRNAAAVGAGIAAGAVAAGVAGAYGPSYGYGYGPSYGYGPGYNSYAYYGGPYHHRHRHYRHRGW
jgi:hypothetical protein